MPSIHDIKLRIKSIKDTRQITNAMKLISSAKLKKARLQLETTLPYFNKVWETIGDILMHMGYEDSVFFDIKHEKQGQKKALLILSGDKGLAGSYNQNILKLAEEKLKRKSPDDSLCGRPYRQKLLFKKNYQVKVDFTYPVQNPTVSGERNCGNNSEAFRSGEVDEISLIYTQLITPLNGNAICEAFAPGPRNIQ